MWHYDPLLASSKPCSSTDKHKPQTTAQPTQLPQLPFIAQRLQHHNNAENSIASTTHATAAAALCVIALDSTSAALAPLPHLTASAGVLPQPRSNTQQTHRSCSNPCSCYKAKHHTPILQHALIQQDSTNPTTTGPLPATTCTSSPQPTLHKPSQQPILLRFMRRGAHTTATHQHS